MARRKLGGLLFLFSMEETTSGTLAPSDFRNPAIVLSGTGAAKLR
jgi:hypothetical protein